MDAIRNMSLYTVKNLGQFLVKLNLYLRYGYVRYAVRYIPDDKELEQVDTKILKAYSVTFHRTTRANRRKKGLGNVVYIRYKQMFILLADEGKHESFDRIKWLTFRTQPLHFQGYSVGIKANKPNIIVEPKRWKAIKKKAFAIALHDHEKVVRHFQQISPFTFAGITNQKWKLFLVVNKKRKRAGLPNIRWEEAVLWRSRKNNNYR